MKQRQKGTKIEVKGNENRDKSERKWKGKKWWNKSERRWKWRVRGKGWNKGRKQQK